MKKALLSILFFLATTAFIKAQEKIPCTCSTTLTEVITDIETNYPGYKIKTAAENKVTYDKLKSDITLLAAKNPNREDCFYLLEKYLAFFKDNHIILTDKKTTPSQQTFNQQTAANNLKDDLTGIWFRKSDSLRIEIIKNAKQSGYLAYIISSQNAKLKKGAIHFELIGNQNEFRIRQYNYALTTDLLRGRRLGNLLIEPNGIWEKQNSNKKVQTKNTSAFDLNTKFDYKYINPNTYYIGIPGFTLDPQYFDSLIVNKIIPELKTTQTEHLIIDLRNNVGGNGSFLSLIRLVFDKPFALPGDFVYSTPKMMERYKTSSNPTHKTMLPKLMANVGGFVQRDSLKIALKEIYTFPKTVSVLVNENCASSTEYFLILAKHSDKVKVFGRHTAGTLDYSELLGPEKLSCEGYSYMRPTTKSFWVDENPIDNKGIIPDVDLSRYPDNIWVDKVVDYLKKLISFEELIK